MKHTRAWQRALPAVEVAQTYRLMGYHYSLRQKSCFLP